MKMHNLFLFILLSCAAIQANPHLHAASSHQTFWETRDPQTAATINKWAKICLLPVAYYALRWYVAETSNEDLNTIALWLTPIAAADWYNKKVQSANDIDTLDRDIADLQETLQYKQARRQALLARNNQGTHENQ